MENSRGLPVTEEIPPYVAQGLRNDSLSLIILPTEQCNFRCTYCYEDFSRPRMNSKKVRAIKYWINRRSNDIKFLSLEFFGGEPLIASDSMVELSRFAQRLARRKSIVYGGSATTNGYFLNQRLLSELVSAGIKKYQISLDGFGKAHDQTRRRADGAGTFDRIWGNIKSAKSTSEDFHITLRVHFTPHSFELIAELLSNINHEFAGDSRFSILFHDINRLGGAADQEISIFHSEGERSDFERRLLCLADKRLIKKYFDENYVCYAAKLNSFVVRSDGVLSKCTVKLNDPRNIVGYLSDDGRISVEKDKFGLWVQGLFSHDHLALSCPALSQKRTISFFKKSV